MMSSEHIRVDLLSFRIDTPRLTLRPITQSDAGVIQVLADDAEIARNTLQIPHPYPPGEASKWIERAILAASAGKILTLVLTAKPATLADGIPADTALGTLSLGFDWPNSRGELGYWLGTAYHGRGMMTEAVTALVRDSFDRLGLARVFAQVFTKSLVETELRSGSWKKRGFGMRAPFDDTSERTVRGKICTSMDVFVTSGARRKTKNCRHSGSPRLQLP